MAENGATGQQPQGSCPCEPWVGGGVLTRGHARVAPWAQPCGHSTMGTAPWAQHHGHGMGVPRPSQCVTAGTAQPSGTFPPLLLPRANPGPGEDCPESPRQCPAGTVPVHHTGPPGPLAAPGCAGSHRYTFHQNSSVKIAVKDTTVTCEPQTAPGSPQVPAVFPHHAAVTPITTAICGCTRRDQCTNEHNCYSCLLKNNVRGLISLILAVWMCAHAKQFSRNSLETREFQPAFHTDALQTKHLPSPCCFFTPLSAPSLC